MPGIVVLGSINHDLVITTPKIPVMGETVKGSGFMSAPGGKGANQAVAAARLGGKVSFIGMVGDDSFGENLKGNLAANSVNVDFVKTASNTPTGTAVICLYQGDNFIILDPGANSKVDSATVDLAENIIKNADMLMVQLEIPMDTVVHAMKLAKKHHVPVLLNPAPAVKLDKEIFQLAEIITPNESECEIITGLKADSSENAAKAGQFLLGLGVKHVVITLGDKGAMFSLGGEMKHIPAEKVERVVDTTAAGDCFSGALAVMLTEGKSLEEAVKFACRASAIAITVSGAQPSLPYREDVTGHGE